MVRATVKVMITMMGYFKYYEVIKNHLFEMTTFNSAKLLDVRRNQ